MSELQHRIFLAPCRPSMSWSEAQAHWRSHHEAVMLEIPGLIGYVQNRPSPAGRSASATRCASLLRGGRGARSASASSSKQLRR